MPTNFRNRDILSISEFSKADILKVLEHAQRLKAARRPTLLQGQVLGSCFFEPSTRTRLSFESAMQHLGGGVIGFADPNATSTKKGETLYDTIKIVSGYADVITIRHYLEGAARRAAEASDKPIINCGDGANQHPTQTLIDLFTIAECQKKLNRLNVALVGDLKYGRTVHSLAQALVHFNATLYLVAPDALQLPTQASRELREQGVRFSCHRTIEEVIAKVDILYLTRIQEERFGDPLDYERVKNAFVLSNKQLGRARPNLRILHPLPRVHELLPEVDATPYAQYFEQAHNGLFVREALLGLVLGKLK